MVRRRTRSGEDAAYAPMSTWAPLLAAIGAALLFGASTPYAKALLGSVPPFLLAGLFYLGSGAGLWLVRIIRDRGFRAADLSAADWLWFAAAIAFGGALGPALLMYGLARAAAAHASLLLNLEAVLTALLAWIVFGENADRRIMLGMALIAAGGIVLAWPQGRSGTSLVGALSVAGACACWAVDNNLTRKVSAADPLFIAGTKGFAAGITNLGLALACGAVLPRPLVIAEAMSVGFLGYGVSLVLFVLALRGLGAARTGAYFSTAPFVGAAVAIGFFHEPVSWAFVLAAALMAAGVWLHLSERHVHQHLHGALTHTHSHRHDIHHLHAHDFPWDGSEPHTHPHHHAPLRHSHFHYPDLHHRHGH
jgi:drug/metabolite transporter (DMT)-like permease